MKFAVTCELSVVSHVLSHFVIAVFHARAATRPNAALTSENIVARNSLLNRVVFSTAAITAGGISGRISRPDEPFGSPPPLPSPGTEGSRRSAIVAPFTLEPVERQRL